MRHTNAPAYDLGRIQVEINDLSPRVDVMGCPVMAYFLLCALIAMEREICSERSEVILGGTTEDSAP